MKLLGFFGFGWSKWETVEENKPMIEETTNPIRGHISSGRVFVDVQKRTNKFTGEIKYKNIVR